MTSVEAKEILNIQNSPVSEENFPVGTFVVEAGLIVDSISSYDRRSHLVTDAPTDAQAAALSRDFCMIAPHHSLGTPFAVNVPEKGLDQETCGLIEQFNENGDTYDVLVVSGINRIIDRSKVVDDKVHKLLNGSSGPKVVGITIGEGLLAGDKKASLYDRFGSVRRFEARIRADLAVTILAEHFSVHKSEEIARNLASRKQLNLGNIISITNLAMEKAAKHAA